MFKIFFLIIGNLKRCYHLNYLQFPQFEIVNIFLQINRETFSKFFYNFFIYNGLGHILYHFYCWYNSSRKNQTFPLTWKLNWKVLWAIELWFDVTIQRCDYNDCKSYEIRISGSEASRNRFTRTIGRRL